MAEVLSAQEDQRPESSHKQPSVRETLLDGFKALEVGLFDDLLPNGDLFLFAMNKDQVAY